MCPACITTAVLIAGSVVSTGGVATAVAVKKLGRKSAADEHPTPAPQEEDSVRD